MEREEYGAGYIGVYGVNKGEMGKTRKGVIGAELYGRVLGLSNA